MIWGPAKKTIILIILYGSIWPIDATQQVLPLWVRGDTWKLWLYYPSFELPVSQHQFTSWLHCSYWRDLYYDITFYAYFCIQSQIKVGFKFTPLPLSSLPFLRHFSHSFVQPNGAVEYADCTSATPVHNSILVTDFLSKMGIKTVFHPSNSRDLAPCDFCLFLKLRSCR